MITVIDPAFQVAAEPATSCPVDFNQAQRYIDIGHSQLAYWRCGQGPDLLFIHGWPLHSATFRNSLGTFAQHFTCHLIDLPGSGLTRTSENTLYGYIPHAQSLQRAIAQLELNRFGLIAHDSGGIIARYLASDSTDQVYGLVMGNTETQGKHSLLINILLMLGKTPGGFPTLCHALRFKTVYKSNLGFGSCFQNNKAIEGEFFDHFIAPLHQSKNVRQGLEQYLKHFDQSAIDQLPLIHSRIKAPVHLLWGDRDPLFPLANAKNILSQFPGGATLEVFEQGKAFIHEEYPQQFAQSATQFLQNNRQALHESCDFKKEYKHNA